MNPLIAVNMKLSPVRRTPDLSHVTVGITRLIKKREKSRQKQGTESEDR